MAWLIVGGSLLALWVLATLKKSRPDGTFVKNLHKYRRLMAYIMPTRNESVVYFDDYARADALLEYVAEARERFHVDVTHCLVAAVGRAVAENPRMNQFVAGRRLYARKGVWLTFSMKRKKLNKRAKLAAVKIEIQPGESFESLCERVQAKIGVERSGEKTYSDKELNFFDLFPRPVLNGFVKVFRLVDYFNLLPKSFIENDGFYTSAFIANLGSLGMRAGFHHLYEWGTCPLFMMVGRIEDRPVVEDGEVVVRKMIHIRWSYDERIDDGLTANFGIVSARNVIQNPRDYLGCLAEDGSDAWALTAEGGLQPPVTALDRGGAKEMA